MTPIIDIHLVSEAIRDAVAPVFLLTGIGSILNVMVGRLGRAIDRASIVNALAPEKCQEHKCELTVKCITCLRVAIGFATLGALLACVSIASLFVSVESALVCRIWCCGASPLQRVRLLWGYYVSYVRYYSLRIRRLFPAT